MQKNIQNIYLQVKKVADFCERYNKERGRMVDSPRDYGPIKLMQYDDKMQREYYLVSREAGMAIEAEQKPLLEAISRSFAASGKDVNEDSALFSIPGLKLTIDDVREICKRNPNNVLITRMADKWCTDNITSINADQIESLHLVTEKKKLSAAKRLAEDCFHAVSNQTFLSEYKIAGERSIQFRDRWDIMVGQYESIIGEV